MMKSLFEVINIKWEIGNESWKNKLILFRHVNISVLGSIDWIDFNDSRDVELHLTCISNNFPTEVDGAVNQDLNHFIIFTLDRVNLIFFLK